MTMRVTMTNTRMGESGTLLVAANTYTVSDAFGAALVGQGHATDTDKALTPKGAENFCSASRNLDAFDINTIIKTTGSTPIVLTIMTDTFMGPPGDFVIGKSQRGTGNSSFVAGIGVTLRGTPPTPSQFAKPEAIWHSGVNEWDYL